MKVTFTTSANAEQIKKAIKRLRPGALVMEPDEKPETLWILTGKGEKIPITNYDQSEHFAWFKVGSKSFETGYSLTHKPTGANICYLDRLEILWSLVEALEKLPVDWSSSSVEEIGIVFKDNHQVNDTLLFYVRQQYAKSDRSR